MKKVNKKEIGKCFCGGSYYITKMKGKTFEAQCSDCVKEGITNIIKGTLSPKKVQK